MSYNGIGLSTARGSGTNGYVQKNYTRSVESAFKRRQKNKESNEKRDKLEQVVRDRELVKHDEKRKVELQVSELRDELEDQDVELEEIERRCEELRKSLMKPKDVRDTYKKREVRERESESKTRTTAGEFDY